MTTAPLAPIAPAAEDDLAAIWRWGAYRFWMWEGEEFGDRGFA